MPWAVFSATSPGLANNVREQSAREPVTWKSAPGRESLMARRSLTHRRPAPAPATEAVAPPPAKSSATRIKFTTGILLPLALAQFCNSYGTQAMQVAISNVTHDLNTSVTGVQASISLYTLMMAAGMIVGSKLADLWGRKRAFNAGVILYGLGGLIAAVAPNLFWMTAGYSVIQGVGSDLMIPALYILVTVNYTNVKERAAAFGVISAAGGLGAAIGPLLGGIITTTLSWRFSFFLQVPIAVYIVMLRSRVVDPSPPTSKPKLDMTGAVISGLGMTALVLAALMSKAYGWVIARQDFDVGGATVLPEGSVSPVIILFAVGVALLLAFGWLCTRREKRGKEPLVPTRILFDRVAVAGLVAQAAQWFLQLGITFVVIVFVQQALGLNAIQSGVTMLPAIVTLLFLSRMAAPLANKFSLRLLMQAGFLVAEVGALLIVLLADSNGSAWRFLPGLAFIGAGMGLIMPASITFVQSTSPEQDQAAISGVSRSASNLGSSLGTAVAGSIFVVLAANGDYERALNFSILGVAVASLIGLAATVFMPARQRNADAAAA